MTDYYVILSTSFAVIASMAILPDATHWQTLIAVYSLAKILETTTSNVYFMLLRPNLTGTGPHSQIRSLVSALTGYVEIGALCAWWWRLQGGLELPASTASLTIATKSSIPFEHYAASMMLFGGGFANVAPSTRGGMLFACYSMACIYCMTIVVVGRAISILKPPPTPAE